MPSMPRAIAFATGPLSSRDGALPSFHDVLKAEGLVVNHKRTERLYRERGLWLRRRRRSFALIYNQNHTTNIPSLDSAAA